MKYNLIYCAKKQLSMLSEVMIEHYQDYYWKMGKPYGKQPISSKSHFSYKIITDPYHKRYSIEKYQEGVFDRIIYDSLLLDFRHLKPSDQLAWQRENLSENPLMAVYLLRDQNDRAILLEIQSFCQNWCRSCMIKSIHGVLLSTHRMYYKAFKDHFDGVVLYDSEERPVMMKTYQTHPDTGEFTDLLIEYWDMQHPPSILKQPI